MPMQIPGAFDTRVLTGVVNKRPHLPTLFRNLFFPARKPIASKFAELEIVVGGKKLLPFVGDGAAGKIIDKVSREKDTVRTPRIRVKEPFSAQELLDVTAPGGMSYVQPDESRDAAMQRIITEDLDELDRRIVATEEWMCAQVLCGGQISYADDEHAFDIDFRMPTAHKVTLGAGVTWADAGVNPMADIDTWANIVLDACGLTADTCIMSPSAWQAFYNNEKVQKLLDTRRIDSGSLAPRIASYYQGNMQGVDFFKYGGSVTGHDGQAFKLIPDGYLVFAARAMETKLVFGLPEDLEAGGRPMERFAKSFMEKDPSALWLLLETRPLPQLRQPDALIYAKVI